MRAGLDEAPIIANTCYRVVSDSEVVHVASVRKWDAAKKTLLPGHGACAEDHREPVPCGRAGQLIAVLARLYRPHRISIGMTSVCSTSPA